MYFENACVLKNLRAGMWSSFVDEEETEVSKVQRLVQGHNSIY